MKQGDEKAFNEFVGKYYGQILKYCRWHCFDEEEAKDLMARKERTFSPADPRHTALLELIRIYAEKKIDYTVDRITLSTILDDADAYLIERGFDPLPNCNLQREGRTGAPCRRARSSDK